MTSETAITLLCQGALAGRFDDAITALGPRTGARVQRLLRRARSVATPGPRVDPARSALEVESPEERWWRECFAVAPEASIGAYEAMTRSGAGASASGWIIRPCSLHIGLDHLVLMPAASIGLSAEESDALLEASQAWLAGEPIRITSVTAGLWQLTELEPSRTRFDEMRGASSRQACGRNIDIWLPKGPAARGWRRLANELQMLWHQHPVNLRRSEAGLPVINGLWFEGRALPLAARPFDLIVSDDPVLAGLAVASGAALFPTSRWGEALLDQPATSGPGRRIRRLLIDPGCWSDQAQSDRDALEWQAGWQRFAQWFDIFDERVRPGRSATIDWRLTGKTQIGHLHISRHALLRFWHNSAPQRLFEGA